MKVALVFTDNHIFRYFEGVVRELCSRGHGVKVVSRPGFKSERALRGCLAETSGLEYERLLFRTDRWRRLTLAGRLLDYGSYLRPQHPSPVLAQARLEKFLPFAQRAVENPLIRSLLVTRSVRNALRQVERVIPRARNIARWLIDNRPDVVVASPALDRGSPDVEYIKAAKALNIRTAVAVKSWDHLTTRGTFHIIPDLTFVWNKVSAVEAMTLHDVPKEKIFITGAPVFDFWFEMRPSPRELFCQKLGIDPNMSFVTYVTSSLNVGPPEPLFVREFVRTLRAHNGNLAVVVRPHPVLPSVWKDLSTENVIVWPPEGIFPDNRELKQDYYDTLFHSVAVLGLNTTSLIEGAIANKPCIAILMDHYRLRQADLGHFQRLLAADFLEIVHGSAECSQVLGRIVRGEDRKAANRCRFVREFVRPWGTDKSAAVIMARAIEALAKDRAGFVEALATVVEWDSVRL